MNAFFFLAYIFVTKLHSTPLNKQKAKGIDSEPIHINCAPTTTEKAGLSLGDLIREESTLLSDSTLSSACGLI